MAHTTATPIGQYRQVSKLADSNIVSTDWFLFNWLVRLPAMIDQLAPDASVTHERHNIYYQKICTDKRRYGNATKLEV